MTSLVVEVQREGATGKVRCGLSNLRDVEGIEPWRAFAVAFLIEFCKGHSASFTLLTLEKRDWYSEFCTSEQVPFEVQHVSSDLQIVIRPNGDDQLTKVISALVDDNDEVWNRDELLEISVGSSVLRPQGDGKWFEWVGPGEDIATIEDVLRSSAQKNRVQLAWRDI